MSKPIRVLVVGAENYLHETTQAILTTEPDLELVGVLTSLKEAVSLVPQLAPDVIVLTFAASVPPERSLDRGEITTLTSIPIVAFDSAIDLIPPDGLNLAATLGPDARLDGLVSTIRAVALQRADPGQASFVTLDAPLVQERLTRREMEVLRLVEEGLTNSEMGLRMQRTNRAIQFHVSNLLSKLGARSRTELIHLARKRGLLA